MPWLRSCLLIALLLALAPIASRALSQPVVGMGPDALPGAARVALPTPSPRGLGYALTLGYGYTESIEDANDDGAADGADSHHRLGGRIAGSYTLSPALAFGASFGGHYDSHESGTDHGQSSFTGGTRVLGRGRLPIDERLTLGAQLAIDFPGADSFELGVKAISPELRALAAWTGLVPGLTIGGQFGFRLDRSARGIEDASRLSDADRIAVDASDSSALLLGVAASHAFTTEVHALAELSWDVQVGSSAPGAFDSPLRLQAGARYFLRENLQLEGMVGVSPSSRPSPNASAPLARIEPRVWLSAGVAGSLAAEPSTIVVRGRVVDEQGQPLAGASVFGRTSASDAPAGDELARSGRDGRFSLQWPRATRIELVARAEHHVESEQRAAASARDLELPELTLQRGRGSLRGRVLDPTGKPLAAAIVTVWPLPLAPSAPAPEPYPPVAAAPDGGFVLPELPSGPVEVEATAFGVRDTRLRAVVPTGGETSVELRMQPALPEGQIRLTVRGMRGTPLAAQVRIEPLGQVLEVSEQGTLSIDVVPGSYTLLVTAPGYEPQQRKAEVEQDGVTVLLVDLQRQP